MKIQDLKNRIELHNAHKGAQTDTILQDIKTVYYLTGTELDLKLPNMIISYNHKEDVIRVSEDGFIRIVEGFELINMLPNYKSDIDRALENILMSYITKNGVP